MWGTYWNQWAENYITDDEYDAPAEPDLADDEADRYEMDLEKMYDAF
jgi:hypothetical protein